jgi:hypothetical protein
MQKYAESSIALITPDAGECWAGLGFCLKREAMKQSCTL